MQQANDKQFYRPPAFRRRTPERYRSRSRERPLY